MSKRSLLNTSNIRLTSTIKKTVVAALFLSSVIVPTAGANEGKENLRTVYHVYMNGNHVGITAEADLVKQAVQAKIDDAEKRLGDLSIEVKDQVSLIPEQVFRKSTEEQEVLTYIKDEFEVQVPSISMMFGDADAPQVYVKDQEAADELIKELKLTQVTEEELALVEKRKESTESLPALEKDQTRMTDVRLSTDVMEGEETVEVAKVLSVEEAVELIQKGTLEERKYTIQDGDVLGKIASKHNLSTKELLELNPSLSEDGFLQIGDDLNVTVLKPIAEVLVEKEVFTTETIAFEKQVVENDQLPKGETRVKQEGKDGKSELTYRVTSTNGKQVSKDVITEKVVSEPVKYIVEKGTKVIPSRGTGEFVWPAVGGYVSSKMGMRWGRMHKGIDIARPSERTIKSVDNGKVVYAGYDGGYGNKVVVDHNNGYRTTYAHLESISVSVGQTVEAGGKLGVMGSTGHSTGVHLHLEVEKNGKLIDPLSKL
ncbi:peptidoglycan DD-metalloendopeptidase family protein [Mangrovibacillus cuniculi]|uniref:M23 family metallopeptidase n=1 Tax=Mangrovibacillus cuniculi TaxID=2593652 RepID=A0A7S8CDL1_9BACI|nr:M23 family metallopeptidase [Mangrovibacillus cuniculi]QPC47906.1 M23 family metallopeptidase [Mangrovibacillus cuniculi]